METRARIVEAADRVMRQQGLARSTTKEIARAAGYSEGTLYKHFVSKEDLFLAVLTERAPSLVRFVKDLPRRVGREPVADVLAEVAILALAFYGESVPMGASVLSEPALLARHRELLRGRGAGPQKANEAVTAYLAAEQRRGRVRADVDPAAVAGLLLGACFQRAFYRAFLWDGAVTGTDEQFVADTVRTLMRALAPAAGG